MTKVFIDGSAGTTGLRIYERLASRKDISLMILSDDKRKDDNYRKEALNSCDIAFLCLPDAAAKQAVSFVENKDVSIIDTSTAHRTDSMWDYGFPELYDGYEKIKNSKRIANPGCHASGFLALATPLTQCGAIKKDEILHAFSITGYSGGGKSMIAEYEAEVRDFKLDAPRQYGLSQSHKHLPEMSKIACLENAPLFCPIVAPFYSGMEVTITLSAQQISATIPEIKEIYTKYYNNGKGLVKFADCADENGFVSASALCGRDDMQIAVFGNDERILLVSRFDNLGKGASGSAIQNMNIILGADEKTGLVTE